MTSQVPAGIQAISKADIHRITSGQVVLDIQSAVKELIENALDAGARAIEVRFKEYGSECIEVVDNGSGIKKENYASLGLKHHTSKLSSFQDLAIVQTFGFRGEALSSLCELSDVQVITATKEEEPVGTVLDLNRDGSIRSQDKRVARQRGTTVSITNLFATLPVRRRELIKNIKREFAKAQTLLQAYAIISRGVRWVVTNSVKGRKSNIMTITGSDVSTFIVSNVSSVFGSKSVVALIPLDLQISIGHSKSVNSKKLQRILIADKGVEGATVDDHKDEEEEEEGGGEEGTVSVEGLISRPTHGSGRSSSDRIFLYVNGRPWDSTRIVRAFNEIYKSFNHNQYPMVVANFTIGGDKYDVNVSPDKRTLFLHDESEIIDGLKTALEDLFNPFLSKFTLNGANMTASKDAALQSQLAFKPTRSVISPSVDEAIQTQGQASDQLQECQSEPEGSTEEDEHLTKRRRTESQDSNTEETREPSEISTSELGVEKEKVERKASERSSSECMDDEEEEENIIVIESRQKFLESRDSSAVLSPGKDFSRGRKASEATIEAKLMDKGKASRNWTSQLRSFAAPSTEPSVEDLATDENDESEQEDADRLVHTVEAIEALEYREEGLTALQMEEANLQRQEYRNEALNVDEIANETEEAAEEREANYIQLEEEAIADNDSSNDPTVGWKSEIISHVESSGAVTRINLQMDELRERIVNRSKVALTPGYKDRLDSQQFEQAGVEEKDVNAVEETLSRSIDKTDFAAMKIIGQFNLGFILVRRTKSDEDDVFIVDQHAADEKYNFETLQRETTLKSQTLIQPRRLELASSVEFVAAQHIDTLAAQGFLIRVNEEAKPGSRVELLALPISKNTTFGVTDLEELLYSLAEVPPDSTRAKGIHCSRLRNILASRACRKSVMIGKALTQRQMNVILRHMGEIEQPWNCPHGRPTMRHLHRLDTYPPDSSSNSSINWQSLL